MNKELESITAKILEKINGGIDSLPQGWELYVQSFKVESLVWSIFEFILGLILLIISIKSFRKGMSEKQQQDWYDNDDNLAGYIIGFSLGALAILVFIAMIFNVTAYITPEYHIIKSMIN